MSKNTVPTPSEYRDDGLARKSDADTPHPDNSKSRMNVNVPPNVSHGTIPPGGVLPKDLEKK